MNVGKPIAMYFLTNLATYISYHHGTWHVMTHTLCADALAGIYFDASY
ncbi:MAG: hypothetical protein IAF02_17775 [Anaerolineae bacterium]|nr:hypothetical protein [Anaerolineae bacterium]